MWQRPMTGAMESHLRARVDGGAKLLVPYVTGGFPGWEDAIRAAADAGADAIEIGRTWSDIVLDSARNGLFPTAVGMEQEPARQHVAVFVHGFVDLGLSGQAERGDDAERQRDPQVAGEVVSHCLQNCRHDRNRSI